jgi:prepilin-type processing-associated H-X9-DG protein
MDTVIINLANAKAKSQAATCLSQGKRLGLSIIYYVEDHEEVYPPIQSWVQKTKSKWDSPDLITCPLDEEGYVSYSMNKLVAGQSVAEMYSPAETVLLYEGRDAKLSFKHDGKAVVVFADGHVRLITAEAAKNLIWTMDGSSVGEQR